MIKIIVQLNVTFLERVKWFLELDLLKGSGMGNFSYVKKLKEKKKEAKANLRKARKNVA